MIDVSSYLGIPFVANGRTREGCDCWGLVRLVYDDAFGICLPKIDTVDAMDDAACVVAMPAEAARAWVEVGETDLRPGDVVLLSRFGRPRHVGVLIDPPSYLHTEVGRGVSVRSLRDPTCRYRPAGYYRHPAFAGR